MGLHMCVELGEMANELLHKGSHVERQIKTIIRL